MRFLAIACVLAACGGGGGDGSAEIDAPAGDGPPVLDGPSGDGPSPDAPSPDAGIDGANSCGPELEATCSGNTLHTCFEGQVTDIDCDPLWPRFCQYDPATDSSGCYECIDWTYCTRPPAPPTCVDNQAQRYAATCTDHACAYTFTTENCPTSTAQPYCDGFTRWTPLPTCVNGTCYSGGYGGETCFGGCANGACNPTSGLTWSDTGFGNAAINPVGALFPRGPNDLYFAALWQGLDHYDGTSFTHVSAAPTGSWYGIWGTTTQLFLAGDNGAFSNPVGRFARFDGNSWSTVPIGTTQVLAAVSGTSATNVWIVGNAGTILRWDGQAIIPYPGVTTVDLSSVWAISPTDVWAVGEGDTILHFDGMNWTPMPSGDAMRDHYDVWGSDAATVFVVGTRAVLRRSGNAWTAQTLPVPANAYPFRGVWGASATEIFITGNNGWILRFDGNAWTAQDSNDTNALGRVRGVSATEVYAGGANQTLLKGR